MNTVDPISMPPTIENLFDIPLAFTELLDEIAIGVIVLDRDRNMVVMNQALKALTGFSPKTLSGVACAYLLRSDVCLKNCPALNIDRHSGSKCTEGNLINRDRQKIHIRITSSRLKDIRGNVIGFLETVEDIRLLRKLDPTASHAYTFENIIGRSPEMEKIFRFLPSLAQSDSSVLLTGETGTGKDLVAQAIHRASNRARGPFVKINCGALPEALLESELFGHRKGAFTGAVENKPGRIQLAQNGTLYLTEIGDLPLALQVKLLTFLDDKEVFPLGSIKGFSADVRVIAATHRNLEERVSRRQFRKDLLFRLNVIRLHLPPLRERQGDVQLLLDHFFSTLAKQAGKRIDGVSREAVKLLKTYPYPGNVRELKNIVEYAVGICEGRRIRRRHLPTYLIEVESFENATAITEPLGHSPKPPATAAGSGAGEHRKWTDMERRMIMEALIKAGGRKAKAAVSLGWARSTLWRKMKQHGLN